MEIRKKYSLVIITIYLTLLSFFSYSQTPSASFNLNQTSGCSPLTVVFSNTSVNGSSYYWDFGNGNVSVLSDPSNVYSNPGTYTVKLIAISANGQKDSVISSNLITVSLNSTSNFYTANTTSCFGGNIFSFVNTSSNSSSCLWDFGDGNTSVLQNPTHSYASQGNYTIKLIAYNSFGCSDVKTRTNYISVIPKVATSFTVNDSMACDTNQIFNFSSTTPGANSWLWSFGDGSISIVSTPQHTYATAGSYTISLITGNANNCTDTLIKNNYISITSNQTAAFTSNTTNGCTLSPISFSNNSTNVVSWLWNFGDSVTSTLQYPTHTYQNSGNYTISLAITTSNNCSYVSSVTNYLSVLDNSISSFSVNNTTGCAPMSVQFTNLSTNDVSQHWNFGDGFTSSLENPSHIYTVNGTYTVTLETTNSSGCISVYQLSNAILLAPPSANFSSNYIPGCAPLTTSFTNSSSYSSQWLWNFGDGTISTLQNPVHTFNLPGDYDVSLIAYNAQGCSDTLKLISYILVTNTSSNYTPPPTLTGCVPMSSTFQNNTTDAVAWFWDFGDGTTSTLQNPSHTFTSHGFYTVSLTIQLNGGCTQVYPIFRTFDVQGAEAGFTFTQTQCTPYVVSFTDTASANWTSWFWDFGDGTTSTLQNPLHTYSAPGFYSVIHSVTTSAGCTNEIFESNLIHFSPCSATPDTIGYGGSGNGSGGGGLGGGTVISDSIYGSNTFILIPFSGCIPLKVHFHNILSGTVSWQWDFGDGSTSVLENPIHIYNTDGNYSVTMIATNSLGLSYTIVYSDYIHASGIQTNFTYLQNNDCINSTLSFNGMSQNAISWLWNFGDGSISTIQNPTHTFSGSLNNFIVTLTTFNAEGCSSSMSTNILNSYDVPALWANKYFVCSNQTVSFNCSSSNFVAYLWDFGDSTFSTLQNPTHLYLTSGIFNITLVVSDNDGCTHSFSLQNPVTVQDPIADFSFALASGCNSQTVNFTNLSTGISLPLSSQSKWDFGDGYPIQWGENPTHTYTYPGSYQVTLFVNNDSTCFNSITIPVNIYPTVTADFTSIQNTTCLPITVTYNNLSTTAVSWLWVFGDGTTSTLQNPVHTFFSVPSPSVILTITDTNGCQAMISKPNITIFNASFSMSVTSGCAPLNVVFTDQSFNASNWLWDFGDGTISTLQNPSHLYLSNGTYAVMLLSQTIDGCADTMVFNSIDVNKPTADFMAPNPTSCAPTLASFTDLSTGATSWLWDFGDGSMSVSQNPAHIYNIPGSYSVKLIVTNSMGCNDTLIRFNYIKVPGSIANFSASATQSCANSIIQFADSSVNAATWTWNFGDGNTSAQQSPSHIYQYSGTYSVSLIVNDSFGCTSNFTLANPIIINTLPVSDFTVSNSVICSNDSVSFLNNSLNASSYLWNFGDGTTSALQNPSHIYFTPGIDNVTLITSNGMGCSDTSIVTSIIINEPPIGDFSVNARVGCSPFIVSFSATSGLISSTSYLWDFGNGITSTQPNPIITFITPGNYTVSLIVTNANGCSDTAVKPSFIQVYDFNPPSESSILFATVTSDTSTFIKWNQCVETDFAYYKIFRKDISTGNYISIAQVNTISTTSFSDINLNTLSNSYCYKVQTFDICGYAIPLDSLSEHCTINVTASGINDYIHVQWTPYIGASVASYEVYRMEIGNTISVLVATVPFGILSIIDTSTYCPIDYSYRISANNLNGNMLSSNSDTSVAKTLYSIITNQQVDIVRSTVIDNSKVLTEWTIPSILPDKITGYTIYRSTDSINFSFLAKVTSIVHEFIDTDVDVSQQNYYYKIEAENGCNVATLGSNKSSSVLLKVAISDGNVLLNWTKYEGWNLGVDYYIIEKMDDQGVWNAIKTVDGNQLIYEEK